MKEYQSKVEICEDSYATGIIERLLSSPGVLTRFYIQANGERSKVIAVPIDKTLTTLEEIKQLKGRIVRDPYDGELYKVHGVSLYRGIIAKNNKRDKKYDHLLIDLLKLPDSESDEEGIIVA